MEIFIEKENLTKNIEMKRAEPLKNTLKKLNLAGAKISRTSHF